MSACSECGGDFAPRNSRHHTCGPDCARDRRNRLRRAHYRRHRRVRRRPVHCVVCGARFRPRSGTQLTCSPPCAAVRKRSVAKATEARRRIEGRPKPETSVERAARRLAESNERWRAANPELADQLAEARRARS